MSVELKIINCSLNSENNVSDELIDKLKSDKYNIFNLLTISFDSHQKPEQIAAICDRLRVILKTHGITNVILIPTGSSGIENVTCETLLIDKTEV